MNVRAVSVVALLLTGACESVPLPEGLSFARPASGETAGGTIVTTIPEGALLNHPDGSCRTPCRVSYPEKVQVLLAKEGYAPIKINIPVGARDATFEMRPVGRSSVVEEVTLPEL